MNVRVFSFLIGYLFGNFITAFFVAKLVAHRDPTTFGSGNPGTANVGAVLGKKAGIMVLIGDLLKTILALLLANWLFPGNWLTTIAYTGLGLTLGHDFPFWRHFQGGKGVAVSVILVLFFDFQPSLIILLIALGIIISTQNLALPPVFFMLAVAVVTFYRHGLEGGLIFLLLALIMLYKFWPDLVALKNGTAKKVDILKTIKRKLGRGQ